MPGYYLSNLVFNSPTNKHPNLFFNMFWCYKLHDGCSTKLCRNPCSALVGLHLIHRLHFKKFYTMHGFICHGFDVEWNHWTDSLDEGGMIRLVFTHCYIEEWYRISLKHQKMLDGLIWYTLVDYFLKLEFLEPGGQSLNDSWTISDWEEQSFSTKTFAYVWNFKIQRAGHDQSKLRYQGSQVQKSPWDTRTVITNCMLEKV